MKPDYANGKIALRPLKIDVKSDEEISRMREAGKLAKHVLSVAKSYLKVSYLVAKLFVAFVPRFRNQNHCEFETLVGIYGF